MDTADRVSVVALVVSLIALLIALLQALQQYFATADGYRNCAESVIGPWHRTRNRDFVPSEFRFETVYEAPLIRLLTSSEREAQESRYGSHRVHALNPPKWQAREVKGVSDWKVWFAATFLGRFFWPSEELFKVKAAQGINIIRGTVHPPELERARAPKPPFPPRATGAPATVPDLSETRGQDLEKSVSKLAHPPLPEDDDASLVSWIPLMRELHRTYHLYWPQNCDACITYHGPKGGKLAEPTQTNLVNSSQKDPIIIQRTIHWDFHGSRIARPVAFTTVGDIIILALRMGMHWRTVEPQNARRMHATGNGYSLSITAGSEGGLVLSFTAAGRHGRVPGLIPSKAADKLLFGILPGDPDLVKRDFNVLRHVENPSQQLRHSDIFSHISTAVQYDDTDSSGNRLEGKTVGADMLKLLCPFLPLERSCLARVRFAGWYGHKGDSQLFFWQSRLAIFSKLEEAVQKIALSAHQRGRDHNVAVLDQLRQKAQAIETEHPDDFFNIRLATNTGRWIANGIGQVEKVSSLIEDCRGTHEYCTKELLARGWDRLVAGGNGKLTRYTQLVVVHCRIAMEAACEGDQDWGIEDLNWGISKGKDNEKSVEAAGALHASWQAALDRAETPAQRKKATSSRHFFWMRRIVDRIPSLRERLARQAVVVSQEEAEVAWWLMMVRGIAWDMSCYREAWPEDSALMYPALYDDQTPVMLA